jgi:hypothetical protein
MRACLLTACLTIACAGLVSAQAIAFDRALFAAQIPGPVPAATRVVYDVSDSADVSAMLRLYIGERMYSTSLASCMVLSCTATPDPQFITDLNAGPFPVVVNAALVNTFGESPRVAAGGQAAANECVHSWTFDGPRTMRDGVHVGRGEGISYRCVGGTQVYVLGADLVWYEWTGVWSPRGTTDPGGVPQPWTSTTTTGCPDYTTPNGVRSPKQTGDNSIHGYNPVDGTTVAGRQAHADRMKQLVAWGFRIDLQQYIPSEKRMLIFATCVGP